MIKKELRKNILLAVTAASLSFMLISTMDMSVYASEIPIEIVTASEEGIEPHSDIIEWRYKDINGVLYRRLFNYSKECWVGEWEVCPW